MKKYVSLLLTVALLLSLTVSANAAVTDTFVDEIPADSANFKSEVVEFSSEGEDPNNSHKIAVENNPDLGATLLLKTAAPRSAKWDEYIVYKMAKNICGFKFDVMCCAGLGNPLEDITVYISKTGAAGSWQEVSTQATKYTYDEDIYINFDKAYWHQSTLMNKKSISTGYKYIKIQFNGCTESIDVPWNVAIDKITIYMGTKTDPVKISDEDKFETYEQINATKTTKPTGGNTTADNGGNNNTTAGNNNGGSNKTTKPVNGSDKTTKPIGGSNNTTKPIGGAVDTPVQGGTSEVTPGDSTTSGDSTGNITDGDPTASVGGNVGDPTDAPAGESGDPSAPAANENVSGDNAEDKGPGAWLWIVIGVVVLLGAGAGVFFFLKKKKA